MCGFRMMVKCFLVGAKEGKYKKIESEMTRFLFIKERKKLSFIIIVERINYSFCDLTAKL